MNRFAFINRITAAIVFAVAFLGYLFTISPTLSYWDCGEFAATAYTMAIPHPPGSPLFLLLGRIFSILPTSGIGHALGLAVTDYDIAFRINLISTFTSAFAVLFLYLTTVRLILQWKERPESTFGSLKIVIASAISALTFAFTYSQWFNAVESEVYAASIFCTAIVTWLITVWLEKPDDIHSDVYLLLIAYILGLAIGIHLLVILALPFIFFLIYTKKFEITFSGFFKFLLIGLIAMGVIYKVFLFYSIQIPFMLDRFGLSTVSVFLMFAVLIYLSFIMIRNNNHNGALIVISSLLIFLGYSTYATIMIRSGLNPNVDQNDPDTWSKFISYLNREQYGELVLWPRNAPIWEYQIKKMFVRYFNWQFIGRPDEYALSLIDHLRNAIGWSVDKLQDTQEDRYSYMYTVLSFRGLYALPFLVGIFGMIHHFSKDWKRALSTLGLFIMTGIMIIVYVNQPDPQPRERDYSYVGAFFAFSIWIGIGIYAIFEFIEEKFKDSDMTRMLTYGVTGVAFILLPLNMFVYNKFSSSRQGNYVAWDYSYNLLVTCEPNAILYTNGDNDTFPLWYLQEVEKVRPDVRIVNLSLVNTEWYINQMKNLEPLYHMPDGTTFKALKVPVGFSDREILGDPKIPNSSIQPMRWDRRDFALDVPKDVYWKDWVESGRKLPAGHDTMTVPKMKFTVEPTIQGRGLRVQDLMVLDILFANKFERPIYFAITVSNDNMCGLDKYLRMDGLAMKLVGVPGTDMSIDHMYENTFKKYKYRNMNNPNVAYDDNVRRLTQNYRTLYLRMAEYYRTQKNMSSGLHTQIDDAYPAEFTTNQKIVAILDSMEKTIPQNVIPVRDYRLKLAIGQFYSDAGKPEKLREAAEDILANEKAVRLDPPGKLRVAAMFLFNLKDAERAKKILEPMSQADPTNPEILGYYTMALEQLGEYAQAAQVLEQWIAFNPKDVQAQAKLNELKSKIKP